MAHGRSLIAVTVNAPAEASGRLARVRLPMTGLSR